MGFIYWRL